MAKKDEPGVRQLDYAIMVLAVLMAIAIILIALAGLYGGLANSSLANSVKEWNLNMSGFELIFNIAVYAAIAYGIYWFFVMRPRKKAEFDASPEHPFKVNVAITPVKDTVKILRSRAVTHALEMDVKISQKDWQRIKDAGLYDATLFEYRNTRNVEDDTMDRFEVSMLRNGWCNIGFYNINAAQEAKETLLKALYNLKDTIAAQKDMARSRETFEI